MKSIPITHIEDRQTTGPMPSQNPRQATALQEHPIFDHMHALACVDEDHGFSTAFIRYSCLQLFHPSDAFESVQVLEDLVTDDSWLASTPAPKSPTVVAIPEAGEPKSWQGINTSLLIFNTGIIL